ncbi:hypothetical protein Tco_0705145 [Tanacetum coccineum]|uniref:Uncharacterized protein n=1 Tax=Tanacetum coccineum TaxID=301880 RepID=A0ABQ4Y3Y7_9ASTR
MVGRSARVISSHEASLGDQEDASKQGRIAAIDADTRIILDSSHFDADTDMFRVHDLDGDEVVVESKVTDKAGKKRNIVEEAVVVTDAVTIPVKPSESTPTRCLQLPSQVKGQGSKDKGKAKMIEPEKPLKKKDHIKFDEEDRLAREKAQQVEEANIAWDDIQAKIDVDYQLAKKLQAKEQQELTIEEKSTLFVQLLEKGKKHFAAKRVEEQRNRPPTRAQQRSIIARTELEQEVVKKQKVDVEKETEQETAELQRLMEIVSDEEGIAIDAIPLATKPPSIVDWQILTEGKKSYYQIIRAGGQSKRYLTFLHMLKDFDREDLETLWKLMKDKHGSTRPEEGYERVLWGDLKTMFEPKVEDEVWKMQQMYRVLNWKLFDSCRVHCLTLQSGMIYMLVEKRYPLTPSTITEMLNRKLQADH